jgi:hypothetical protein
MYGSQLCVADVIVPILSTQGPEVERRTRDVLGLNSATEATELGACKTDVEDAL